jgi:hypothetical protein
MSSDHKIAHIRKVKQAEYGDVGRNMGLIGKSWSALVERPAPIAPDKVCLMYVVAKVIRAAHSFKEDNFIDALNYLRKAEELQRQKNGEDN